MAWNPKTYLSFESERTRPAGELLARVPVESPARVADLGCGPGNSTAPLRARWPSAHIDGLDSSAEMLAEARALGIEADWIEADLATWHASAPYDVIFSNATLQWLGDHAALLPRLMGFVKPGGTFAFQVPNNMAMPSHALMRETAADGLWSAKLKNVREVAVLTAEEYYSILEPCAAAIDLWQTEYFHVLDGEDAVYRWVSGTGLRPFLDALEATEREAFIRAYKARLAQAYPLRPSGKVLFPFRRLFVVARR